MKKNNKRFLQAGLVIGISSFVAAFLISKNVSLSPSHAWNGTVPNVTCSDQNTCGGINEGPTVVEGNTVETVVNGVYTAVGTLQGHHGGGGSSESTPTPTPVPTPTLTPTPTVAPTSTHYPRPSHSPRPRPTYTPYPTSTPVTGSSLTICKYNDSNNDGQVDNGEGTIGWTFYYSYQGNSYQTGSGWWNLWNAGCSTVNVPANQWITVSEASQGGWTQTGIYANGSGVGTGTYSYIAQAGAQETVWFLNYNSGSPTPTPTGVPNYCGGTCGSNTNCQSGLFCYQGYCRNPNCQNDVTCGCAVSPTQTPPPVVLGATAPPVLPKTGSDDVSIALGLISMMAAGFVIFKKFRLI